MPSDNPDAFGAIEQQRAFALFAMFHHQKELALDAVHDGCYARCHLISLRLRQMGIEVRRAWAFSSPMSRLRAKTERVAAGFVEWDWHVAPLVPVKVGDQLQWWVFDPCLCTRPITLEEWRDRMRRDATAAPPALAVTQMGEPPIRNGIRTSGSGYWLQPDPREGPNAHAVNLLRRMKSSARK